MYLDDDVQNALRGLNKIAQQEVVKKQGDLYVAVNVLTGNSRILQGDNTLIESLIGNLNKKKVLKG
tara:strand:+ start:798 stop:995 length:198 start_codon:yes stop_codon:yes gene_type:complete